MSETWTNERVKLLMVLKNQPLSAADIAARLGGDLTRNSVIGFCRRKGIILMGVGRGYRRGERPELQKPKSTTAMPVKPSSRSKPVVLRDARDYHCRWIEGDALAQLCCGAMVVRMGAPYCAEHQLRSRHGKQHGR
jgi:hypothetical protein